MKIFINHSSKDAEVCAKLADALLKRGYEVFANSVLHLGENIIETIKTELNDSDIFVAVITENFLNSSWVQAELSSVIFSNNNIRILPVVVGDIFVPSFLNHIQYRKVKSLEDVIQAVLQDIEMLDTDSASTIPYKRTIITTERDENEEKIILLKNALRDNQLTLVCGAGVSIASSIPAWNELLINILNEVFFRNTESQKVEPEISGEDLLQLMP